MPSGVRVQSPFRLSPALLPLASLLLALLPCFSAAVAPAAPPYRLYWDSLESLSGSLVGATSSSITWQSDLFAAPITLDTAPLLLITRVTPEEAEQPAAALPAPVAADFKIVLTNGDCLFANLLRSSARGLTITSQRHGEMLLPFASIQRLTRLRGGTALYAGPRGSEGWPADVWEPGVGGSLTSHACYKSGKLDLALPQRFALDLTLSASARLRFAFRIFIDGTPIAELSLWDGFLVLSSASGPKFTPLLTLQPSDNRLALRLLWDGPARSTTVLDAAGHVLGKAAPTDLADVFATAEKPAPKPGSNTPTNGLYLINDSQDLTLERLIVRPWNGKLPPALPPAAASGSDEPNAAPELARSHAELADGSHVQGRLAAGKAANEIAIRPESGPVASFAIALLEEYVAATAPSPRENPFDLATAPAQSPAQPTAQPPAPAKTHLQWPDGTQFTGDIQSLADGVLTLRSPLFQASITAPLADLSRLVFNPGGRLPPSAMLKSTAEEGSLASEPEVAAKDPFAPGNNDDDLGLPTQAPADGLEAFDVLQSGPHTLHGQWEGGQGKALAWRCLGASAATALRLEALPALSITRAATARQPGQSPAAALFMLSDNSIIAGTLRAIDDSGISLSTPLAPDLAHLPSEQMLALAFLPELPSAAASGKPNAPASSSGELSFLDPAWRLSQGSELVEEPLDGSGQPSVILRSFTSITHPSLLAGGDIEFHFVPSTRTGTLGLSLFREESPDGSDSGFGGNTLEIEVIHSGNSLSARCDSMRSKADWGLKTLNAPAIHLRLSIGERTCRLYGNDKLLLEAPLPIDAAQRQGIALTAQSHWGRDARPIQLWGLRQSQRGTFMPLLGIAPKVRKEALTIPRFRREALPQHLLVAHNGDLLRGRIDVATPSQVKFTSGLDTHTLPTARIASAIWLHKPKPEAKPKPSGQPQPSPEPKADLTLHLVLRDSSRLALLPSDITAEAVLGQHPQLGACRVPLADIETLHLQPRPLPKTLLAYHGWQLEHAQEPVLPENGSSASPLLGKPAPPFTLDLLGGGKFDLAKEKGRVVILDFWASWCGPCTIAMPELMRAAAAFPPDKVKLIGINQGEPAELVQRFLKQRQWPALITALDPQQTVGPNYGVEGIPHTVLISPEGKVLWTAIGYHAGEAEELIAEIRKVVK